MLDRKLSLLALTFLVSFGGCKRAALEPMYCEGGVTNGKSNGGDCLVIDTATKPDSDPNTVGTLRYEPKYQDVYTMRRVTKDKYDLLLGGVSAGTLEQKGDWVTLTLAGKTQSMRSDTPGVFQ